MTRTRLTILPFVALSSIAFGGDWSNSGGNAGKNGRALEPGPTAPTALWSTSASSIIAWQPIVSGERVFQVRQTGFPPAGEPNGSPIVCQSLATGATLWTKHIPYNAGEWTTWVGGASQGKVYASRAGNGGSIFAKLHALDEVTGNTIWVSQDLIKTGAYDGVVFAQNGDPIVAWHLKVMRIRASDGTTVWSADRLCSVSGSCGVAVHGNGIYLADAVPGGHAIKKYSLETGAFLYQGPTMTGFTLQNTPMVAPDGTICLSRTQNNAITDFFYTFTDTGAAIVNKWSVAAGWSTNSEFGVAPDGSIYLLGVGGVIERRDGATGALLNSSVPLGASVNPRFAIDCDGKVFVGNGGFSNGRLYSFNADLTLRWSTPVTNINIGGPSIGEDGTLVVSGVGTDSRAYRTNSVWKDLGNALAGSHGKPTLCGSGSLQPNTNVSLLLEYARPNSIAFLFIGTNAVNLPLLGGTLVPSPDLTFGPLALPQNGILALPGIWPAGIPSGVAIHFQSWIADAEGPQGVSASNGLRATAP